MARVNGDGAGPPAIAVDAPIEASLADVKAPQAFQFERLGYFCVDAQDSGPGRLVFKRTVTLRDSWAKEQK